jgi:hypothetical protein
MTIMDRLIGLSSTNQFLLRYIDPAVLNALIPPYQAAQSD